MRNVLLSIAAGVMVMGLCGCQSSDAQQDFSRQQDQAVADPMGYTVNMDDADIMGGDIGHFDAQAMKKDLDAYWNP